MTPLLQQSVMAGVSGVALQGNVFGSTEVTTSVIALFAIATVELLAATAVAAAASRVDRSARPTLLPRRVRRLRDRVAPRPLDVFLTAAICFVATDLYLLRPGLAALLAGLTLGAFAVAAVLFGGGRDGAERSWTDRTRVVREAVAGEESVPGLERTEEDWTDRTRVVREAVADEGSVPGLDAGERDVRRDGGGVDRDD
jgi:hypothetical protein